MQAEGCVCLADMDRLSVIGLEGLVNIPGALLTRRRLTAHFLAQRPKLYIGVDAPDFNLPVELKLKQAGIKTVHYVSPSVWAWRQKRIVKIAAATDLVLALLPFEKAFYDQHQVPCTFVGHTLADQMPLTPDKTAEKQALGFSSQQPLLALMPGSRTNEIKLLAGDFLHAATQLQQQNPELQLVCNMVTEAKAEIFQQIWQQQAPQLKLTLLIGRARQTLTAADAVFIASGTATLEAMLAKTPMVVAYKTNWLTYQIASRLVHVDFFSLPNLLAKQALVPELLQHQVTVPALVQAMLPLLNDAAAPIRDQFIAIHQSIRCDASAQAATAILELIDG